MVRGAEWWGKRQEMRRTAAAILFESTCLDLAFAGYNDRLMVVVIGYSLIPAQLTEPAKDGLFGLNSTHPEAPYNFPLGSNNSRLCQDIDNATGSEAQPSGTQWMRTRPRGLYAISICVTWLEYQGIGNSYWVEEAH
ncbi:hypothetical protein BDD12DRAFT_802863 [Trichophaea hybrida]|nr:hypothetical protein BDD12DRAFT_804037 [Trichophaea hybrida]KAF8542524.1 hypothetical protein BDD12DRAFT_802863 [Trichophaea hybrida]